MTKKQQEDLAIFARSFVGVPYRYGAGPAEAPRAFDCSSFTQYVFKHVGIDLPRSSILQAADPQGKEISPERDFLNLETGDLLFMRGIRGHYNDELFSGRDISIGHVALYLGNHEIVHARGGKFNSVIVQNLEECVKEPRYRITLVKRF